MNFAILREWFRRRSSYYILFALLCFGGLFVIAFSGQKTIPFPVCVVAVAALYLLFCAGIKIFGGKTMSGGSADHLQAKMSQSFLPVLNHPVVILDEKDKIIWYNDAFSSLSPARSNYFGKQFSQIVPHSRAELLSAGREGLTVDLFDKKFVLYGYPILQSGGKKHIICLWEDITPEETLRAHLRDQSLTIAYLSIDNLDEVMSHLQDEYRSSVAEVSLILRDCAKEAGGFLKEYERDRFILILDRAGLDRFISSKFDILDKVREIRIGESSMPITVSMGISGVEGTPEEKEVAARAALDMALQRGGDQAVIKTENGMEYYGGKSRTVQKHTKVRARGIANRLVYLMSESSNVLIMGHKNPDFDSIASCAGLARLAIFCGVDVHIVIDRNDGNLRKCFEKLDRLPEYDDLFLPASEAQDFIRPDTLLIVSDVNNRAQFEAPDLADAASRTVVIDHHRKTAEYPNPPLIDYIDPSVSSASELVAEILEQCLPAGTLPKEEADLLLAGILLDTRLFSKNTGVRTFSAALYLRGEGAVPSDAHSVFGSDLDEVVREAVFESNVILYRKGIAIATNEGSEDAEGSPLDRVAAAKAADKFLTVDGVTASFTVCRIGRTVHISARSGGKINVQLICEKLGGGGRFDAAAVQMENISLRDALEKLKKAIDEYPEEA